MSDTSSLQSSLDSNDNEGPVPLQLTEQNGPRKPLLRRISTATSSFFSNKYRANTGDQNETFEHDIAGTHHIHKPFRRSSDEEQAISDIFAADDEEQEIQLFFPASDEASEPSPPLQRRQSTVVSAIQNFTQKFGFWDKEFISHRNKIFVTLFQNYLFILVGFTIALCIYWGVYYDRPARYRNIHFAVVLGDESGSALQQVVEKFFQSASVQAYGTFDVFSRERIAALAQKHNISIGQEVVRQVHHQHYQGAFYVQEGGQAAMVQALQSGNGTFSPATELLSVYYETGSDYNAVTNYISSIVQQLCVAFFSAVIYTPWTGGLISSLTEAEFRQVLEASPQLLTEVPNFQIVDLLPVPEQVVQAPLQVGLIYLCMFTFFQFLFSLPIQMLVAPKLKGWGFVFFRISTAQTAYFVLSLAYMALNCAFGIPTDLAFGRSGFLVIWAIAFLTMSSVGSLIEILVLVCVVLKPAMIGLVLLIVAVTNLAVTINPIYLCPKFYRYGYAMPVYNSYHLLQVAYFNSWKGHFGRHIGVLCAWIVVTNCMMPVALKWVGRKMEEKRTAAAAAAAAEKTLASKEAATSYARDQPVTNSAYSEAVTRGTEDIYREQHRAAPSSE